MKLAAAALALSLLLAGCGQVEPLRRVAEAEGSRPTPSSAAAEPGLAGPGPEARPEVRHPFLEPQRPREDDRFDLPPT
jgi:hypothetical protein